MQRTVEKLGRTFKIRAESSAYETGYGVYFNNEDGKRGGIQYGVHLTSRMELVSIPYMLHGTVTNDDLAVVSEIVSDDLRTNPNVFHIVENGRTESKRLGFALRQSEGFNHIDSTDGEYIAVSERIKSLEAIIKASTNWASDKTRGPFKEFLAGYVAENHASLPQLVLPLPPMGPIDLVKMARSREKEFGNIAIIPTADSLSRVPFAVAERADYHWPGPWRFSDKETKWVHMHRTDFKKERSEKAQEILSREDTLVLVWTRRTDAAAFERICSVVSNSDANLTLLLGSPEGSFIGRVNDLKLALETERLPEPAM